MKTIFLRTDFELCYVPVPKGYPQSQTHCGIGIWGDRWILTTSPYPNPKYPKWRIYLYAAINKLSFHKIQLFCRGEKYENPCVYIGRNDKYPTFFSLVSGSPLMNCPKNKYGLGSYCSDPDLFIENGLFHVLNRTSYRKAKTGVPTIDYETVVHLINFSIENDKVINKEIIDLFHEQYASPCLIKFGDYYYYYCLDTNAYNTGEACKALYVRRSKCICKGWSEKIPIKLIKGGYEPWHMSIFTNANRLYSIVACIQKGISHRCWTMLGEFSEDLSSLKIYQTPLTDYKTYRSAAIVKDGEFILYNTTVHEKIKGGTSVDGREIIMAHMPFDELLKNLQKNEK